MNKSVVRLCGSCSMVMLIVSWCRLLKAFEKSSVDICCFAVSNCLENCLFHVKFRGDDISVEASYCKCYEIQEPNGRLRRQTS